jgi:hypothetical protein
MCEQSWTSWQLVSSSRKSGSAPNGSASRSWSRIVKTFQREKWKWKFLSMVSTNFNKCLCSNPMMLSTPSILRKPHSFRGLKRWIGFVTLVLMEKFYAARTSGSTIIRTATWYLLRTLNQTLATTLMHLRAKEKKLKRAMECLTKAALHSKTSLSQGRKCLWSAFRYQI